MAFTNSPLVNHIRLCNDYSPGRYHRIYNPSGAILKITLHHMAGNLTIEKCGDLFATSERQVSSTYGVGTDGRIGLYVEEKNRPWTSSSADNDYKAVTVEIANDRIGGNWHISDKALASTINLCVDVCKRNGIKKLIYTGDETGNLTLHKFFAATNCPGPYLESKMEYIAKQVNKRLNQPVDVIAAPTIKVGDIVSIKSGAKYYTGKTVPAWVCKKNWIVKDVSGTRVIIDKSSDGKNAINSAIYSKYLTVVKTTTIKEGDKVKLASNAVVYGTTKKFQDWVYKSTLYAREIKDNRVVISTQKTGTVTGAVDKKYLTKA